MQRYFIEQPFTEGSATLTGDSAKHIAKVMRMTAGDEIIVVSEGVAHVCEITAVDQNIDVVQTGRTIASSEMPVRVTIACGLPKGDKLELITQKGTELGMHRLVPFKAERSIVKWDDKKGEKKTERLQKIALEAAEQSHRTHVPVIENPLSFQQLIAQLNRYDAVFIADEEDAKLATRTTFAEKLRALPSNQELSILCIFGPEGGIARNESDKLLSAGAQTMSLGPRILRAETAPLYALSAISYEFE